VEWVSLALKRAPTTQKIMQGFKGIRIWPLNLEAIAEKMGPLKQFQDLPILGI
jgi:hypothetical protein